MELTDYLNDDTLITKMTFLFIHTKTYGATCAPDKINPSRATVPSSALFSGGVLLLIILVFCVVFCFASLRPGFGLFLLFLLKFDHYFRLLNLNFGV